MKTVLIVENHSDLLGILSDSVEKSGYLPIQAANGAEALKAVAERDPDVILMEIALPDMDGLEIIKKIKNDATTKDMPVIALSARTGAKEDAHAAGADAFVPMPAFPLDIVEAVNKVVV